VATYDLYCPLAFKFYKDLQGDNEVIIIEQENYKLGSLVHSAGQREGLIPGRIAGFYANQSDDQVATHCNDSCLGAAGDTQLEEDTSNVESHSGRAYHQLLCYLWVALSLCD